MKLINTIIGLLFLLSLIAILTSLIGNLWSDYFPSKKVGITGMIFFGASIVLAIVFSNKEE